jgi:hypothetical protein
MTRRMPRAAVVGISALLVVGSPLLAGCSMVEGIIEQQTGGDVTIGGDTVPEDFPTADVPLPEGQVLNGSSFGNADGKTWNILFELTDPAAPDSITAQLEAAGFIAVTAAGTGFSETGGTLAFAKLPFAVNVLLGKTDSGWTANYTVVRSGG